MSVRRPRWRLLLVAAAVALVGAGVATEFSLQSGATSQPTSTVAGPSTTGATIASSTGASVPVAVPSTTLPALPRKPVIRGLLDRSGAPAAGYPVNAWVVPAFWADLQPQQDGSVAANNAIDSAIAQARDLNAHGGHMALKLRVYAGIHSPDWAKQLGGAPVAVTDPASGEAGTIPRFWTPEFAQAYRGLQAALAARYDFVPEIREVVISQCTTIFAEPFLRQASDPASRQALLDAGFTTDADNACQRTAVDAHGVWRRTASDLAVNPYQSVDGAFGQGQPAGNGAGRTGGDLSFPESVMRYCRQHLGSRCVLENNSLRESPGPAYPELYQAMKDLGGPITFQTATARRAGDLATVVGMAADLGAVSVELPVSYKHDSAAALSSSLGPGIARLEQNPG